jgi:filamentous hemagglutinin family protein
VQSNEQVGGTIADLIQGGATRSPNLFHSFVQFNVAEGQQVYFANPNGINTILGRVTGVDASEILGTLGVDGGADLFLLNPNGIVFGPNAQLEIAGSFTASTAETLLLGDNLEFRATNPNPVPLLTVDIQPGISGIISGNVPAVGNILNQGRLAVGPGESLTLYGNEVTSRGTLRAPGGLVQVLGNQVRLEGTARINVSGDGSGDRRAGRVLVGGDRWGLGSIPTALNTTIGPEVIIEANGMRIGDGGEVIIFAEGRTDFAGTVQARGA